VCADSMEMVILCEALFDLVFDSEVYYTEWYLLVILKHSCSNLTEAYELKPFSLPRARQGVARRREQ